MKKITADEAAQLAALGASHLAHEGLLKRAITNALVDSPRYGLMGLNVDVNAKPRRYRSERVAMWYESRKMAAK
jgi:hypothetical protein